MTTTDMHYLRALEDVAAKHKFRMPTPDETWQGFTNALADHVEVYDIRESIEIRYGMAWNQLPAADLSGSACVLLRQ